MCKRKTQRRASSPRPATAPAIESPFAALGRPWRQQGIHLFNQQLWCWGRDVCFPDGNLLVRYGFERQERPTGVEGSSIYRLPTAPGQRIILRGFGAFIGDDRWGGLFLKRFDFSPGIRRNPDLNVQAWQVDDLPEFCTPGNSEEVRHACRLFSALIDWICAYERWVRRQARASYRREVVDAWAGMRKERPTPSHMMTRSWKRLQSPLLLSDLPAAA